MRASVFLLLLGLGAPARSANRPLVPPVHPDTLPTLFQVWTLPASLAPGVTNAYAPRMTLQAGVLYVFDHHGRRLAAVEASTGKVRWHSPVPSRSQVAFAVTPLVASGRAFVATDGFLYSFATADGEMKWKLATKGVAVSGLARSQHRVILPWIRTAGSQALPGVNVWAVDSRLGRVEWSKKFPGKMAFVAGDAGGVYFVGSHGHVLGLTPDRGDYKWQLRVQGRVQAPPILKGNRLYVTFLSRKVGWVGTGLVAIDIKQGKPLWQTKLSSTRTSLFLNEDSPVVVEGDGRLTAFDDAGNKSFDLELGFVDEPRSLHAVGVKGRAYVFTSHSDGNGYIRLVDLTQKKVLATANALDLDVRALISTKKMLLLDGADGEVYALRLDRSQRPLRREVPPEEFASELLDRVKGTTEPVKGLALKLAGLGAKALPAIESALSEENPFVVQVAAEAIGLLANKRSVPPLVNAVRRLEGVKLAPEAKIDPLLAVVDALAELKDGRAVPGLQRLMQAGDQSHHRRRAAYVALGAIGTPVSLAPIWAFRAALQVSTYRWDPPAFTGSYAYRVDEDVDVTAETWPEAVRKETTKTIQSKSGQVFTAALSPYLGGYNDLWVGPSDLGGVLQGGLFTGLTRPEVVPNRRVRITKLEVNDKRQVALELGLPGPRGLIASRPITLSLEALAADSDGDKLPDAIEKRLHTCVTHPDCDGDGLKDAEDVNPLASGKLALTAEQQLYREAFFTYFAFLKRRGVVIVDPGNGPSFEVYGRRDPVLSLRRATIERFRKEVGLHAVDTISFGGPYPEGGGSGDALPQVLWGKKQTVATIGMDVFRSAENAVAYNVTLKKSGKTWVVSRMVRVWSTN